MGCCESSMEDESGSGLLIDMEERHWLIPVPYYPQRMELQPKQDIRQIRPASGSALIWIVRTACAAAWAWTQTEIELITGGSVSVIMGELFVWARSS